MDRSNSCALLPITLIAAALTGCGGGGGGGGPVDTTPPTITATDPPPDAVGVQVDDPVVVTFSEPIAPASVDENSFVVLDDGGQPVTGGTRGVSGRTARFNPTMNTFDKSKRYQTTLTTAITDVAGNPLATDFVFNFVTSTDAWTPTATTASPEGRLEHTAVWATTTNEMIVWGGATGMSSFANTGGRYSPAPGPGVWAATNTVGAPLERTNHTAVWTGNQMIVWGGDASPEATNTGGIYSPPAGAGAGTWAETSLTNAPAARSQHTAVWTGAEMIVWGGATAGLLLTNTGGRFNPNGGGSWDQTSTAGAPSGRVDHTAVWTGTEMIVWGGNDGTLENTGGSYRPATDSWSSTATSGAPSPRDGHTAVWTGTEMIVWGGNDGVFRNDGGRYNPATNSWRSITAVGAPSPRRDHTAIWTGTEMIIWGGAADNSGGAYNPARDEWRSIATTNAPPARAGHTAVWTGREMIIWGGSDGLARITGGRYVP